MYEAVKFIIIGETVGAVEETVWFNDLHNQVDCVRLGHGLLYENAWDINTQYILMGKKAGGSWELLEGDYEDYERWFADVMQPVE